MLSSISAAPTLNGGGGHRIRNDQLLTGIGREDTRRRVLHLRDWRKRGNNDEVVVVNKSEDWINREKRVRGGGQEDRTTVSAKEVNKNHENTSKPLPQDEGLRDQPMMKHMRDWRNEEEFVHQELPEQQQLQTYGRAAAHRQSQQYSYGSMLHLEEVNNPPLSYPHPPNLENELEESPPNQMDKGGGGG